MNEGIQYTRHARNRMRRYKVTEAQVVAILAHPLAVTPSRDQKQNAWGRLWVERTQTEWVSVSFVVEHGDTVVITVTPRRRGPAGRV